jgi:hypothetical protein
MNLNICYNPKTLLESAGAGWLWSVVFIVISIGLAISFVSEIFKIQKSEKPDFAGVAWKGALTILLYLYLPDFIEKIMLITYRFPIVEELDEEFFKAFSLYSSNLLMISGFSGSVPSACPQFSDPLLGDAGTTLITSFYFQYFCKLAVFLLMLFVWTAKEVIFSYGWGTLMSLNMVGLCFALVFPAFPDQGFASIGGFFRSIAVVALWPVLYAVFIFVTGKAQVEIMKLASEICTCPYSFRIDRDTVSVISGLIFMGLGISTIPLFASKAAGSEQIRNAVTNIRTITSAHIDRYRMK